MNVAGKNRPVVRREKPAAETIEQLRGVDPLLARVFAARGVRDRSELDYGLAGLAPVSSLENIDAAVELLCAHRRSRILIVGDFDADGATSTALLLRSLRAFDFSDVDFLVPNRFEHGYGLSPEIVRVAARQDPALIVTVDNGISSVAGVAEAKSRGISVLVTDHHLPGDALPQAAVIVNPNLKGSRFPSRNLAGVGVAFYLMAALGRFLERQGLSGAAAKLPALYLDLVALGTIADVVPLDHNNRILVEQGLSRIRSGRCVPGILALLEIAGRSPDQATSKDIGFQVGPRINAAGRLEDIAVGIECLLTDDRREASAYAERLDDINQERRRVEADMHRQALLAVDSVDRQQWPPCVCLFEASWHQGIVGLIAARVRERCHRPVIAFAKETGSLLKGSARSVAGVHVRDLIEAVSTRHPGLIERFGGHAMAAGLTLEADNYEHFAAAVAEELDRLYPKADFSGAILTDGTIAGNDIVRWGGLLQGARLLRDAGPWGSGFPEPVWIGDFTIVESRIVGERHLRLRVRALSGGETVDAIAFNQADAPRRGRVRLVYRLEINEFRGTQTPQFVVEQIVTLNAESPC